MSDDRLVTIKISGPPASGKSTVLYIIKRALEDQGYLVRRGDDEHSLETTRDKLTP